MGGAAARALLLKVPPPLHHELPGEGQDMSTVCLNDDVMCTSASHFETV